MIGKLLELPRLSKTFYQRPEVEQIAKELLGKILVTCFDGQLTAGRITETEAYSGQNDKACHANNGKRSARTEVMYQAGGVAYVYLCYGIHHLFNVVTNSKDQADAVLLRALEPLMGVETILRRRKMIKQIPRLTAGPGSLSQAMGIHSRMSGLSLIDNSEIWIADDDFSVNSQSIVTSTRIGIDYAQEDALLLRRYYLANNLWISRK